MIGARQQRTSTLAARHAPRLLAGVLGAALLTAGVVSLPAQAGAATTTVTISSVAAAPSTAAGATTGYAVVFTTSSGGALGLRRHGHADFPHWDQLRFGRVLKYPHRRRHGGPSRRQR